MPKSLSARIYAAVVAISGLLVLGSAVLSARGMPTGRSISFLLVACLAARLKIKLPGLTGTMSVNLPFILLAAAEMSAPEAMLVGLISTVVQCLPKGEQRFNQIQAGFSCSTIVLAVAVARLIYGSPAMAATAPSAHLRLVVAAIGYSLVNTILVAVVIGLTEPVNMVKAWIDMVQLSFPYLVASAGIAGLALAITPEIAWQVPLAMLPVMAGIFQSYRRYFAVTATASEMNMQLQSSAVAMEAHV